MNGKVIIITPLFPPGVGGPARQSLFLKEFLEKEAISHRVFSFDQEKGSRVKKYVSFFKKVLKNTKQGDTLVVFDEMVLGAIVLFVSKIKKVKMVVRLGGDRLWEKAVAEGAVPAITLTAFYKDNFYKSVYPILRFIRSQVLSGADVLIFSSLWYRDVLLSAMSLPREKIRLIKNKKEEVVETTTREKQEYQFIYAGRFTKVKNVEMLVRAFDRVKKDIEGDLLLCGSGPEEKSIRTYITKNNLENRVHIVGPQNKNNVGKLIQKSAICVLPSLSDISPNFLLECQSLGKTSLATEDIGIRSDLRGVLYSTTDSVAVLADNLLKISAQSYQEKLHEELKHSDRTNDEIEWQENWRSIITS